MTTVFERQRAARRAGSVQVTLDDIRAADRSLLKAIAGVVLLFVVAAIVLASGLSYWGVFAP